jgi:pyridoxal phosphate enzyme (YggS family)
MTIAERLERIRATLPPHVTLIAVSKMQPAEAVREAYAAGQRHFGENYAQEWRKKAMALVDLPDLVWHFVGALQTNKVKMLVQSAGAPFPLWIHTVDRESLAQEISRRYASRGVTAQVLLEVNLAGEASKSGCAPGDVPRLAEIVSKMPGLTLRGLTCIPPAEGDSRPHFAALRELGQSLRLAELSMGMSGDYPIAIAEGATMVRIGTAIFGPRPVTPP